MSSEGTKREKISSEIFDSLNVIRPETREEPIVLRLAGKLTILIRRGGAPPGAAAFIATGGMGASAPIKENTQRL
jgi:hypothetical protein